MGLGPPFPPAHFHDWPVLEYPSSSCRWQTIVAIVVVVTFRSNLYGEAEDESHEYELVHKLGPITNTMQRPA